MISALFAGTNNPSPMPRRINGATKTGSTGGTTVSVLRATEHVMAPNRHRRGLDHD